MQVLEAGSDLVDTPRCEAVSSITSQCSKMGKQKKKNLLKFLTKINISQQFWIDILKLVF